MRLYITITLTIALMSCTSKYEQLYKTKPGFYSYIAGDVQGTGINEEYASEVYATPASCQKVITSLVALKTLGPEYKYKTELFVTEKEGKVDDVIIKFSGDPTLTSTQLIALLRPLRNSKINGYILLDASIFKTTPYSRNLMIDDVGTQYATPVSSINIDKNLIMLRVLPQKIGETALIEANTKYYIDSKVITNNEESSIKLSWVDDVIHATGNVNAKESVLELKLSPQDHVKYVLYKINAVLKALNIKGKIKIIRDENLIKVQAQSSNKIESASLADIINPALKLSDNLVFDSIYLSIIHSNATAEIKDWEQGNNIIKGLISTHFGIDAGSALFVDGSGLSRYNRIQPVVLFSLLRKGFAVPEFVSALAKPSEENSTLKNRTQLASNIIAKTGHMSGISCVCGYSLAPYNRTKAFVFMSNSFSPPSKELFDIMDNFISKNIGK